MWQVMPKEHVAIFALLCIIAFGAGYWHSTSKGDSGERVEVVAPPTPTVVTNVSTNIVTVQPSVKAEFNPIIEKEIRRILKKPTGELTKVVLEKATELHLNRNQLTDVKGLEKLTRLTSLSFLNNPDLTKAQIDELKKALPKCDIRSNPTK